MATENQPTSLAAFITRLISDSRLVHDFVKGDETVMVKGENGSYPSLAKIAKDANSLVTSIVQSQLDGLIVRSYKFSNAMEVRINHGFKTELFRTTIIDTDGVQVLAPVIPNGPNDLVVQFASPESGTLIVEYLTNPGGA